MHIKRISLEGFKSYQSSTIELDPHHNVIVGRNGSGKSNFFDAVRFVLGDAFGEIRADNRSLLLHEGTETAIQGHVEIVLDNTDQRFPMEPDEVVLRRSVGLKKDEYFLNMKKVDRTNFAQLLESAGFSRSNPYYIVAQGRVHALAEMTPASRLQVLKDVAGTQVYEEKRDESRTILRETDEKRKKIDEVITSIEERLQELEDEQGELIEYQKAEKARRAIEYWIHYREEERQSELARELEIAHAEYEAAAAAAAGAGAGGGAGKAASVEAASAADSVLRKAEAAVSKLRAEAKEAEASRVAAEESLPRLTELRFRAAGVVAEYEGEAARDARVAAEASKELVEVQAAIEVKNKELIAATSGWNAAQSHHASISATSTALKSQYDSLLDRAGRAGQFKSRKERDKYLKSHADEARGQADILKARETTLMKEQASAKSKAKAAEQEAEKLERVGKEKSAEAAAQSVELETVTEQRKASAATSHDAKRQLDGAERAVSELRTTSENAERSLYSNISSAMRRGIEEVRALSEPSHPNYIEGIHGPLYDLFRPQHPKYNVAVEAVAGNDLFNVVVNDDAVATRILKHLQATKGGRVTLVPLSRLQTTTAEYPVADDCRPLIRFLDFEPTYAKVVQQTFARGLLCRTNAVAAGYAQSHGLTCVTLDGDVANKNGALQGGFVDSNTTRLMCIASMYEARGKLEEARSRKLQLEEMVNKADADGVLVSQRITQLEENRRRFRDESVRLLQDAERSRAEAIAAGKAAEGAERNAQLVHQQLETLNQKIEALEKEVNTQIAEEVSDAISKELETLSKSLEEAQKATSTAQSALDEAHRIKSSIESQLADNLHRRKQQLQDRISKGSGTGGGASAAVAAERIDSLHKAQRDLQDAIAAEKDAQKRLDSAAAESASKSEMLISARAELEAAKELVATTNEKVSDATLREEKFLEKKRIALKARDEARAKLRDLGAIPTSESDKYRDYSSKKLVATLKDKVTLVEKFGHVNKKAVEQHDQFRQQRESLIARKDELDKGDNSIRELITTLDQRKEQAIRRTFTDVKKNFTEVFRELAPKGSASLILKTNLDNDSDDEEVDLEEKVTPKNKRKSKGGAGGGELESTDQIVGLSIRASFTDSAETKNIKSLSGGQKTLVALALIFAIQRVDPAPFYVFDEVDSALDSIHRDAVGKLIKSQAYSAENPTQFVTSTFSPEILAFAESFFAVSILHKVSSIDGITFAKAKEFIEDIQRQEREKTGTLIAGGGDSSNNDVRKKAKNA